MKESIILLLGILAVLTISGCLQQEEPWELRVINVTCNNYGFVEIYVENPGQAGIDISDVYIIFAEDSDDQVPVGWENLDTSYQIKPGITYLARIHLGDCTGDCEYGYEIKTKSDGSTSEFTGTCFVG